MSRRLLLAGVVIGLVGGAAGVARADEGDPPSGPEACVADAINQRRTGGDLAWSGAIQDELRGHAAAMADRGTLDHHSMSERVAGLPDGWSSYGEASGAHVLAAVDGAEIEAWCHEVMQAFWESTAHRETLDGTAYGFVSVGAHWDGEELWVAIGVFAHPSYHPETTVWPSSLTQDLNGDWDGRFQDDDGSVFQPDIERLAAARLTVGCNPPLGTRFCPEASVTRGEMAAFLARAFQWEGSAGDRFSDDDGSVFEPDIEALARREVTEGCNPPRNDRFCPGRPVTRGEMATFLGRALGLEPSSGDRFADTAGSVHRGYIDAVAEAGITVGCDPDGTLYCPDDLLTRAQMAAFLVRAGLAG